MEVVVVSMSGAGVGTFCIICEYAISVGCGPVIEKEKGKKIRSIQNISKHIHSS